VTDPYVHFHGQAVLRHVLPRLWVDADGELRLASAKPRGRRAERWLDEHWWVGARLFRALPASVRGREEGPPAPADFETAARPFFDALARLDAIADAGGARLAVLLVNHQPPDGSFRDRQRAYNRAVASFCRARGIPVLDPIPIFERFPGEGPAPFRLGDDHHWSPAAHALVGRALADFLIAHGLVREGSGDAAGPAAEAGGGGAGRAEREPRPAAGRR
jgi:hypothetical protein